MPKSKQNCEYTTQARGSKSARLEDQMPKRLSQDGCDAGRHTKHCIEQARYPFRCSIVRPSVPVLVFHGSPFRFSTVPPSGFPLAPLRFSTGPPSGFPLVPLVVFHWSPLRLSIVPPFRLSIGHTSTNKHTHAHTPARTHTHTHTLVMFHCSIVWEGFQRIARRLRSAERQMRMRPGQ